MGCNHAVFYRALRGHLPYTGFIASACQRLHAASPMPTNLHSARYELDQLHNPWEKFARRNEVLHRGDNELQFRLGRIPFQTTAASIPTDISTKTTAEVIELFLNYGSHRLEDPVPRRQQLLKDFLGAANSSSSGPASTYLDDVRLRSSANEIALIDDRNCHEKCARIIGQCCPDCEIVSGNIDIPNLCTRLRGEVSCAR
jgi:hypothetical protein